MFLNINIENLVKNQEKNKERFEILMKIFKELLQNIDFDEKNLIISNTKEIIKDGKLYNLIIIKIKANSSILAFIKQNQEIILKQFFEETGEFLKINF